MTLSKIRTTVIGGLLMLGMIILAAALYFSLVFDKDYLNAIH